ncbi:hypothetical protein Glove_31g32 [Diversispora epigaea]|uniref:Transcription elongation factor SPT6 n=1 Tax=Diversispora epigaea TaxID=1348612 RepID=A0A397JP30_9GLOM|nr:hypothetical protein Glove_31g32 [Diversispora epigaea]
MSKSFDNEIEDSIQEDNLQDQQQDNDVPDEENQGAEVVIPMDSSEEEEETDEEAAKEVARGFIVDDEEEDEEERSPPPKKKKQKKRKREKSLDLDDEDEISDDDLDLLEENTGIKIARSEPKFKRLKRGRHQEHKHDVSRIFDEDEIMDDQFGNESDFVVDDDEDEVDDIDRGERSQRYTTNKSSYFTKEMTPAQRTWVEVFEDLENKYAYAFDIEEPDELEFAEGIEAILDPSALKQMRMTEEDKIIKTKDIPERFQLRPDIIAERKLTDEEVEEAARIIFDNFAEYDGRRKSSQLFIAIKRVIKCLGQEFLEVPYIYAYRRDYLAEFHKDSSVSHEILDRSNLWHIYDLEYRYRLFIEKREAIQGMISKYQIDVDNEYILNLLESASSEEALSDLHDYIHHKYSRRIATSSESSNTPRRLKKSSFYEECLSRGIDRLNMGINVESFTKSLIEDNPRIYHLTEPEVDPSIAEQYFKSNPRLALADATKMIALDIAFDPLFRKYVRQNFIKHSVILVNPVQSISESDLSWPFRFLRKHISKFRKSGLFAEIMAAEQKGQIKVKVVLENEQRFLESLKKRIINNADESDSPWHKYRTDVIQHSFNNVLHPIMDLWIKSRLTKDAEQWIMTRTMENFEDKLYVRPFKSARMSADEIPRVAALSWGPGGHRNTECVFLDDSGRLVDHVSFTNLRNRDMKEYHDFVQFIRDNKPQAIVVRCYDGRTKYLLETVQEAVEYYSKRGGEEIPVMAINDEVAKLYMLSPRAKREFPDYNEVARYCISLARMLQNPIGEYAAIEEKVASITHYPLQNFLPREKLIECLQRGFINVITDIGVSINDVLHTRNKMDLLQYVSGLGPRKAEVLIKSIVADGIMELERRDDLIKNETVGKIVYTNCAGFIRVRPKRPGSFDDTRIHPTYYILARKMVCDALDLDDEEAEEEMYSNRRVDILKRLMAEPEKLNDLILDDYAKSLSKYYESPSNLILHNIKTELIRPFADPRRNFEIPTTDQVFEMETGENDESLFPGQIVAAQIMRVDDKILKCRLTEHQIDGVITIGNIADYRITPQDVRARFSVDQPLKAKILSIDKQRFSANLTIRPRDLNNNRNVLPKRKKLDEDFDYDAEAEAIQASKKATPVHIPAPSPIRIIPHPMFHQMTYSEAVQYLKDKSNGSYVVRPSSKGFGYIAITWKLFENIYQHVDIVEKDKAGVSVGRRLEVDGGKYVYSDLDELIVEYVEQKARRAEDLIAHAKFKSSEENLRRFIDISLEMNPNHSSYGFCFDHEMPGGFFLMFKVNQFSNIENWKGYVKPEGYKFKGELYPSIIDMVNGFKKLVIGTTKK